MNSRLSAGTRFRSPFLHFHRQWVRISSGGHLNAQVFRYNRQAAFDHQTFPPRLHAKCVPT